MDLQSPPVATWLYISDQAVNLRRVMVPFGEIAGRLAFDSGTVESSVGQLGDAGIVAAWEAGGSPVATLTPLAAERLGLKLRRVTGGLAGLAWMPLDARERRERYRPGRVVVEADLPGGLDAREGPDLRPDQICEACEALGAVAPRPKRRQSDRDLNPDRLPWPKVLLTGCQPWENRRRDGHCPACLDRPIRGGSVYCLRCDRWGLDWLLAKIFEADRRAVVVTPEPRTFAERMAPAASA